MHILDHASRWGSGIALDDWMRFADDTAVISVAELVYMWQWDKFWVLFNLPVALAVFKQVPGLLTWQGDELMNHR